ncbi:protein phosphatase 2C domain-containing protein [Glycomyces sp. NPDC048151]|uniref:protein phosphatase 2C domain-containing protein n=1 Tax=Glycomyces sp. NPDC048151 TaxID=3364002 RepID=UPI003712FA26
MIEVMAASRPGGAAPNEDFHLVGDDWALVLDGITRYPDDGCVHDVPWYVRLLGAAIAVRIGEAELKAVLAEAIEAVNSLHAHSCDLRNPVTPGATAAVVRRVGDEVEWLVLGDCAVVVRDRDGGVEAVSDGRLAGLAGVPAVDVAGVRRWPVEYVAGVRNREGGYWVAAADPEAAGRALTGSRPIGEVGDVLLCTDGLTRLVERYGYEWPELFASGVEDLIGLVRELETDDTRFREHAKRHDDATAVRLRWA